MVTWLLCLVWNQALFDGQKRSREPWLVTFECKPDSDRRHHHVIVPIHSSTTYEQSFEHCCISLWNSLSENTAFFNLSLFKDRIFSKNLK